MKLLAILAAAALLIASHALAQTKNVTKTISTNGLVENLVVPSGKTLTINAGGSIVNNGTATGFTASAVWGGITGTLSSQTDLQTALDAKAPLASPIFTGTLSAASISLSGSLATGSGNIETTAGNISTGLGIISGNGSGITTLNASNISSGTLAAARIADASLALAKLNTTGTAGSTTYLRGDGAWSTPDAPAVGAEVLAFRDRVVAAGGFVDGSTLAALDAFVVRGKAEGWWSSLVSVYPCVGSNLAASRQKLKYHASEGAALTAGASLAESHYTQRTGWLITTGGTNTNLATGLIPTSAGMSKSSMFLAVSQINPGTSASNYFISDDQTSSVAPGLEIYYQGGFIAANGSTTHQNTAAKIYSLNVASGSFHCHVNGMTMWDFTASSSGTEVNSQVYLFRSRRYGSTSSSTGGLGTVVFGTGLTEALARACNAAIRDLERDVGRTMWQQEAVNFVGDSITAGQGISTSVSDHAHKIFTANVSRLLGRRQANMGMPSAQLRQTGATAAGHYPYRAAIASLEPGVIVLASGTNDVGQDSAKLSSGTAGVDDASNTGLGYNNYHARLQVTLQTLLDSNRSVFCVGPFYRKPASASETCQRNYALAAANAAAQTTPVIPFLDADRCFRDAPDPAACMGDDVHPSALGHARITEWLTALILRGEMWREPSLDFPSISAASTATLTVEVLNAATSQGVTIQPLESVPAGITLAGHVSAASTVTVTATNSTAGSIDPAAFRVRVIVR